MAELVGPRNLITIDAGFQRRAVSIKHHPGLLRRENLLLRQLDLGQKETGTAKLSGWWEVEKVLNRDESWGAVNGFRGKPLVKVSLLRLPLTRRTLDTSLDHAGCVF